MAISFYQLKRWYYMLTGKSIWHVNQDIGKCYSSNCICGYYNNMTEKVSKIPELLESEELPKLNLEDGSFTFFPVAIFQYGLGAYDLFIQTSDDRYERKFIQCVEWAIENQDEKGRWNNFSHYCPETPYSAMAQGEGASLLIRAYKHTGKTGYLDRAKMAIDFMLLPLEEGGTTMYDGEYVYLMEYTFKGMVLNGSIFSWWGLYDYVLASNDKGDYYIFKEKTLNSLVSILHRFRSGFWSMYSLDGLIASPFYHNLHIAQMQAMYDLTRKEIFKQYATLWVKRQRNPFCKSAAFVKKAIQKIKE